ncbi:MAG TPA: ribonuclease III [Acetobacteraceae bacterium]|nr:ribonuclease III [Acetobacteraceae bacterium]
MTEGSRPARSEREAAAEHLLGHSFARPELLIEALTHRSAAYGKGSGKGSNERLEFVGDRVLGLLVAEWLAERFPSEREGALGRRLAALVSQPVLAGIAEAVALAQVIDVAPNEAKAGVKRRATVLADALEAVIGALFLDGGLEPARAFVRKAYEPVLAAQPSPPKDPKTALQEWAQARGLDLPFYILAERHGPPHAPAFSITVTLAGKTGTGSAGTKREAERLAAADLLSQLPS